MHWGFLVIAVFILHCGLPEGVHITLLVSRKCIKQGRIQDLKKGGTEPNARKARACKGFSHAPKTLIMPLINAFWKIAG